MRKYKVTLVFSTLGYVVWWGLEWGYGASMTTNLFWAGLALFMGESLIYALKGNSSILSSSRRDSASVMSGFSPKDYWSCRSGLLNYSRVTLYGLKQPDASARVLGWLVVSCLSLLMCVVNSAQAGLYLSVFYNGTPISGPMEWGILLQFYNWPQDLSNLSLVNTGFTVPWVASLAVFLASLFTLPGWANPLYILKPGFQLKLILWNLMAVASVSFKVSLGSHLALLYASDLPALFGALVSTELMFLLINACATIWSFSRFKRSPLGFACVAYLKLLQLAMLCGPSSSSSVKPESRWKSPVWALGSGLLAYLALALAWWVLMGFYFYAGVN